MPKKKNWTEQEDNYLRDNFCLTNEQLSSDLGVSTTLIRRRYSELGIERPTGKNALARARNLIYRENCKGLVPDDWYELPSTRADSKEAGEGFYWDGQRCTRSGHLSKRKTSSGGCWDCEYGDHKDKLETSPEFREKRLHSFRNWYNENREDYLDRQKDRKNSDQSREWYREYEKRRRQEDIDWRISKSLRDRLYKAVSRDSKSESAVSLIGCSISELKEHLSSQFDADMSWENYGEWHIDHVRPCVSFDLSDPEQQKDCFNYRNLQPMWGDENRSKGGVWEGYDPRARSRSQKLD
ncbi:hypothetical protein FDP08_12835 [Marinobacter panjinensis]|uniref:Uncharacterized protein n=1 Tax=Marinobacter panjinensis TaxID=2576384 RepID=A0A4U6R7L4_9GAMM|nr:hypothetical protein [Marinobacter panjinensis]MCR8914236.1 hypothetical protein [Marinobacter panjinensis]TKV68912.1 hypothetical protein FDP08_12835 [Marinobacter panjinensis]